VGFVLFRVLGGTVSFLNIFKNDYDWYFGLI